MTENAWPTAPVIRARWHEHKNLDPMTAARATIRHVKDNRLLPWLAVVTLSDGGQLTAAFGDGETANE
ncbi:hypothetical protein [Trueperella pyogenes]|uniref:hypothetical protein n=1 Tax=Trueperella pyogenes TaxID=1661 RepID=UPI00345DEA32